MSNVRNTARVYHTTLPHLGPQATRGLGHLAWVPGAHGSVFWAHNALPGVRQHASW